MKSATSWGVRLILVLGISIVGLLPGARTQSQAPVASGPASDSAWSPDGSMFAVSGSFGVALYDANFQLTDILTNQSNDTLAWSPDGTLLAMSSLSPSGVTVSIWDMQISQHLASISISTDSTYIVWKLLWSPDGQQIAVMTRPAVYVYEITRQSLVLTLTGLSFIEDAVWSPDGTRLATVGGGGDTPATINVWETETGTLEFSIDLTATEQIYYISAVAWSPDGTTIALGSGPSEKGAIPVLDVASRTISEAYDLPLEPFVFMAWSPDGSMFTAADDGVTGSTLYLWDASTYELLWYVHLPPFSSYASVAWNPDSSQLAVIFEEYDNEGTWYRTTAHILDAATGNEAAVLELPAFTPTVVLNGAAWNDSNQDGLHQPNETPISNISLNLLDVSGTAIQTTTTSMYGYYYFEAEPGTYTVEVIAPGYTLSPQDQGTDDTLDSDFDPATFRTAPITLAGGESVDHVDAGLSLIPPTATFTAVPPTPSTGLGDFVVLGQEGVWMRQDSIVHSGSIGANQASPGPYLSEGSEVTIGIGATLLDPTSTVMGDTVTVKDNATVYDVSYNEIGGLGDILGQQITPVTLPLVDAFPPFPTVTPGTQDFDVASQTTLTLDPGSYGTLQGRIDSTIIFTGGVYHFQAWNLGDRVKVYFQAPTEIRIAGKLDVGQGSMVVPAPEATTLGATDILIYVNGQNGSTGTVNATPVAAKFGISSTVVANVYVPNGRLWLRENSHSTGAFLGRWVDVGIGAEVTLDSAWGTLGGQ